MGEHQTNNSAIFSIQHTSENTELCMENIALHMENTALLVTFVTNFESLKVSKTNNLSTRNVLNQLKYLCNMKKALRHGSWAQYSTRLSLLLY